MDDVYNLTIYFSSEVHSLTSADVTLQTRDEVEKFLLVSMQLGGIWIYYPSTETSHFITGKYISEVKSIKVPPEQEFTTDYIVQYVN